MKAERQKPTLHRPAVYEIRVPGQLDESWADWFGRITVAVESEGEGPPVTTLIGTVDQAALHSLLRWLYSLGLPLISVTFVEQGGARRGKASDIGQECREDYRRQAQSLTKKGGSVMSQQNVQIESRCHNCGLRARVEERPGSLLAGLWRWHTGWCPGWNAYVRELARKGLEVPNVRARTGMVT